MNKSPSFNPSFNWKSLSTIIVLLGLFLIIGGCVKVTVRMSGFCCSGSEDTPTYPSRPSCDLQEKILAFKGCQQEMGNWCWAASAQCVQKHLVGSLIEQCDIVNDALGHPSGTCCRNPDTCDVKGYSEVALRNLGITPFLTKNPSRDELLSIIKSTICQDIPLIITEVHEVSAHEKWVFGFADETEVESIQWVWIKDTAAEPDLDPSTGLERGLQKNFEALYFASPDTDLEDRKEFWTTEIKID